MPLAPGLLPLYRFWLTKEQLSAQARQKQSSEDIRARVEQTMSKFGKDRPSRESQGDAPTPRDPEELKRLHEDMLNKQKDFISHRKEVSLSSTNRWIHHY
jgi:hypothetical protein